MSFNYESMMNRWLNEGHNQGVKADWVSVLAAVAAAVSALIGLFVGVEQLATASRLRREATFWRESLQAATNEKETQVLRTLHRTAIARIFSLRLVPVRRIVSAAYYMVLPLALLFAPAWITPDLIIPFALNLWTGPVALLASAMTLYLGILRMAATLAEQRRLVGAYLDWAETPSSTFAYHHVLTIPLTKPQRASLLALSVGLSLSAFLTGLIASRYRSGTYPFDIEIPFYVGAVLVGMGFWGVEAILKYNDSTLSNSGAWRVLGGKPPYSR